MFDFKITDNGEFDYNNGTGLVDTATGDDLLRQHCVVRIKSVVDDWYNTKLGANLEEFLGEHNTELTANELIERVKTSLADKVPNYEEDIFAIPKVERESLGLVIFIRGRVSTTPIVINTTIDIVNGVTVTNDIDTR